MSSLEKLKGAKNRSELAELLGFKASALTSIVYRTPAQHKYTTFYIPKKSGGVRTIKAPTPKLKKLQTHLAHLLYACLAEIENGRDATPVAYGFRETGSISANAKNHKRRRYVLNLDLEDFFPTFNFGRVRGFFLKDRAFALQEVVATTIAQIACDGVALPQGSPCSPVISELIGQILDLRLLRFAKKHGARYSRYADDITFSTNQKSVPLALAQQDASDLSKWTLGIDLVQKIEGAGFKINSAKTRVQYRGSRQMVTGLVVNEKANIRSEYYRKARAMCDSLFQTGKYYKSVTPSEDTNEEPKPDLTESLNPLEGILSHIYYVTQCEEGRSVADQRKEPRAIRHLYRRFLFYKYCIAPKAPLIVTEGKTDSIYLREAIKRRSGFHPQLGQPRNGSFEFAVQFYNYRGQAHEIMDLGGGSGDLKSIPLDYLRTLNASHRGRKSIKHKPMAYPVILVVDNDDGLSPIAATVKKVFGTSIGLETDSEHYHLIENLYLVKTPEGKSRSCIEDLFQDETKKLRLKGKSFSAKTTIDPTTEYGKEVFAMSVVKPNADAIDFSGFDPLLERIVSVLDDFSPQ